MFSYPDLKSLYQSNILLFVLLLFVIVYIIINWSFISKSNYLEGEFIKPILITGIIFLIVHMFFTWDDVETEIETMRPSTNDVIVPQYNFMKKNYSINGNVDVFPIVNNDSFKKKFIQPKNDLSNIKYSNNDVFIKQRPLSNQNLNSKYKIKNKHFIENSLNSLNNSIDTKKINKINKNIFVQHKNSSQYGLKF